MSYIVIGGNPVEGFVFHGPFDSEEKAWAWGRDVSTLPVWWVAPIQEEET